jgi:hypothetical protein
MFNKKMIGGKIKKLSFFKKLRHSPSFVRFKKFIGLSKKESAYDRKKRSKKKYQEWCRKRKNSKKQLKPKKKSKLTKKKKVT